MANNAYLEQAPLLPLRPSSLGTEKVVSYTGFGKQQVEPYDVTVEITCAAGVARGAAYFDVGDEFPGNSACFALFLDWGNALIVTKTDGRPAEYSGATDHEVQRKEKMENKWKRIGLARFIWTPSQRAAQDGRTGKDWNLHRGIQCHGPITDQDQKVSVILI
jgi:hypothetical protein